MSEKKQVVIDVDVAEALVQYLRAPRTAGTVDLFVALNQAKTFDEAYSERRALEDAPSKPKKGDG